MNYLVNKLFVLSTFRHLLRDFGAARAVLALQNILPANETEQAWLKFEFQQPSAPHSVCVREFLNCILESSTRALPAFHEAIADAIAEGPNLNLLTYLIDVRSSW